ncbi:MAG: hypothetical protein M3367_02990 [Acidobacteriota bacterium]|nr:hypothetical protein [Acidobacteriota bacterium]
MAWLTEAEFRELAVNESATEISSAEVLECLQEGIDILNRRMGDAATNAINLDAVNTSLKTQRFRRAQLYLAKRALLLIISSRYGAGGIKQSETDINASSTVTYLTVDNLAKLRRELYEEAFEAINSYLIVENIYFLRLRRS